MSTEHDSPAVSFADLGLSGPTLKAIDDAGYETPTPIQREMIPHMMEGRDVVGQAQTGTGKTAAFALPLLTRIIASRAKGPQILVLAPTRELAIQVAESFKMYGKHLKNFRVLPIFGGQDYSIQLKQLQQGVQVVVGTPGRVMDHIRRNTLKLETVHSLVLDEADEMLKMGFIDDVEWILGQIPNRKQTALFSATMPRTIRNISHKYLNDPIEITIATKTVTAQTIDQRCLVTSGFAGKMDSLSRILEAEDFDGMLIFVRTKVQTMEIADKLASLGYAAAALNGDIAQNQRLRTVDQLKSKKLDILVATDVAARGLDVERISHVVNFDIPFDTESYIHRIGRTGRAGRKGSAILFVNSRERSMLKAIERATRQKITTMCLPSIADINKKRVENFKSRITETLQTDTTFFQNLVRDYLTDNPVQPEKLAAALAQLAQGKKPLLLPERPTPKQATFRENRQAPGRKPGHRKPMDVQLPVEEGMERFRIEAGDKHGVKPGNIVGAIANEADINSKFIGRISIYDTYSTVDLPHGMPNNVLQLLQKTRVGSRTLRIQRLKDSHSGNSASRPTPTKARPNNGQKRQGRRKDVQTGSSAY